MSLLSEWWRIGCQTKRSLSMWLIRKLFESHLWSSQYVYVSWFELRFSHECCWLKQWHLAALFDTCFDPARKSHDYDCDGIKLSLRVRASLARRIRHVMTHFHCVSAMSIKLPRMCSLVSWANISWCSWHFAALIVTLFISNKWNTLAVSLNVCNNWHWQSISKWAKLSTRQTYRCVMITPLSRPQVDTLKSR